MPIADFEPVIGLEVHAQLLTQTKIFCGCSTSFGQEPNTQVCPVCLGLPGSLPSLNRTAVEFAVRAGKALGCRIQDRSVFSRKNYFYPDLPKGYQISQFELPICLGGEVTVPLDGGGTKSFALTRIHLEEDAGKNVHGEGGSEVDLNRAGTPLIEIVGEPVLRSADEASEYLKALRLVLVYLGVNDGNLEEGSFRCDANVSVRKRGADKLGTRVELKNINSFRFIRQAIDFEIARQVELLESGGRVVQETRLFDNEKGVTRSMRSKEEANDYRYFPEPDLPPLVLTREFIDSVKLPAWLPLTAAAELEKNGVPAADARTISADQALVTLAFDVLAEIRKADPAADAKWTANALLGELARALNDKAIDLAHPKFTAAQVAEVSALQAKGTISSTAARTVLAELFRTGASPAQIVADKGLAQVSDTGALEAVVDAILAKNPSQIESYKAGKKNLLAFFVGQAMKELKGKGNPAELNKLLKAKLGE
ncbi:MAG: Asp-tRNA(Asn)/Glu-tRNA(Gln) amidotransferase subunit GatB [Deltaproteobacteria bacterium]|nr:Asp-tRNA(Asn)/Glu-tRNA(Gln) amidotransferase subunit GatB [Deltaproteobacteria bacterium]